MHIISTQENPAFQAAQKISDLLAQYPDTPVLLLLAGGSSFKIYDAIRPEVLSDHITVAMTDDRFSMDMDVNNFTQLQSTFFYNEAIDAGLYTISTEVWNEENPEALAGRFATGIAGWRNDFPNGVVIAIFGIGTDGHICGMIPGEEKAVFKERFVDTKQWVVGYTTEYNEHKERITITMPFIRSEVKHAVVYTVGESKREALQKVLAPTGNLHETPARIIRELPDTYLFTDLVV